MVVVLAAALLAQGASTAAAQTSATDVAQPPIGPKQAFAAVVNGAQNGAVIKVACPGPVRPGQRGRALPGQAVGVLRLALTSDLRLGGFTARASSIGVFAMFPLSDTPVASADAAVGVARLARLTAYGRVPIPSDVALPCAGPGRIVFEPLDGGPEARSDVVAVRFQS
jgi:hypothetical protein